MSVENTSSLQTKQNVNHKKWSPTEYTCSQIEQTVWLFPKPMRCIKYLRDDFLKSAVDHERSAAAA